jgi:hypothetical protein
MFGNYTIDSLQMEVQKIFNEGFNSIIEQNKKIKNLIEIINLKN